MVWSRWALLRCILRQRRLVIETSTASHMSRFRSQSSSKESFIFFPFLGPCFLEICDPVSLLSTSSDEASSPTILADLFFELPPIPAVLSFVADSSCASPSRLAWGSASNSLKAWASGSDCASVTACCSGDGAFNNASYSAFDKVSEGS